MGWDDENAMIKVYIIGGRVRPNTLAVVNDSLEFKQELNDDFKNMLGMLGGADVAFVGTNGIHRDYGFSTHNNVEIYTKQDLWHTRRVKSYWRTHRSLALQRTRFSLGLTRIYL
ncbi:MAG: hypothetical protein IPO60_08345 [Flavobacteriales bacterium]|nr:hypothetical protein [Flavobacteriales bacterium]